MTPSLRFAEWLASLAPELSPPEQLHALAAFDGGQLLTGRWNLGALYLLPELREARLASFWTERERLRLHYLRFSVATAAEFHAGAPTAVDPLGPDAADLPFRLVEALVNIRAAAPAEPVERSTTLPAHVADAGLRVLGVPGTAIPRVREHTRALLARHDGHEPMGL